jgi:hypothetical protein
MVRERANRFSYRSKKELNDLAKAKERDANKANLRRGRALRKQEQQKKGKENEEK